MLLGNDLLGGAPLGSLPGSGDVPEPIVVGGDNAIQWVSRVVVAGVDWSARVTGETSVLAAEGGARVAQFTLCLPPGPVLPLEWRKREVTIDYLDNLGESRLFTGRIVDPVWNRTDRTLSCTCSDQLQEVVEALPVEQVDSLTGGLWSEDVFEPVEGRSHWDYAQERMSTRTASLECDAYGVPRVSSWYAKGTADYVFGEGATIYDTVLLGFSEDKRETNRVLIEADYRFSRLRQLNKAYHWQHPFTGGLSGEGGFCAWFLDSTELPNIDMILDAVTDSGQQLLSGATWYRTMPQGVWCDPPIGWNNPFTDQLLGFSLTAARRWTQVVTERYALDVRADAAITASGELVQRDSLAMDVESDLAERWESTAFGVNTAAPAVGGTSNGIPRPGFQAPSTPGRAADDGVSGHTDVRDEPRRQAGLRVLLNQAAATIVGEHRGTTANWDVPGGWVHGIDLEHTAQVDDQGVLAKGKIQLLQWRLDHGGGAALCSVTVALMRGGGDVNDPLTPPAFSVEPQPEPPAPDPIADNLPTQIGGKGEVYDDELDGFSGTWSVGDGVSEGFTRRFQITADEIPAEQRDELVVPIEGVYRVAIPNDLLELN
ncbi:hypothetical protein [Ectopseudomonas mendocina]|uniref:Uncharacterized protein n=1 Tax=Ectopseudomonas mendocina TaxID=300 RepID=A0A2R3QWL5_ECTME|nr:hypothetical protein [Pseudomonas mendocina]AVO56165.1 hypothetical protein C7A17_26620 [Pseudomonas mendocina]